MGYPLQLSARYMNSKKGAFISVGTAFAIIGVALGVAALATVMSVTGGFQKEFRDKVLGVNAHVLVLKYTTDFREYRDIMDKVEKVPGVVAVSPFIINPMMVSHGDRTATGVLLKGVDPERMLQVLHLPGDIKEGSLKGLRRPGALPPTRSGDSPPGLEPLTPGPTGSARPDPLSDPKLEHETRTELGDVAEVPSDDSIGNDSRRRSLLRAIEESMNEPPREPAPETSAPAPPETRPIDFEKSLARGAPRGSIVPEGGYKSELPDDDVLPPDVAPDPCSSSDSVEKMPGIVVGVTLAQNLNLKLGDCMQVTSPTIGYTFSQGSFRPPIAKQFRVIATFEAGFEQYDAKLVYTDLYEAQEFYGAGDSVMGVEMKVNDIDKAKSISRAIDKLLANGLYHTMDWEELNHGLFTALKIQKYSMSLVLFLIIVVAAFTVVATLIMIVLEKKKEIAVLKAMGATNSGILRTFLYQGGFIGGVGTSLGLLLGLLFCKVLLVYAKPLDPKVYFISHLPVEVSAADFLVTGALAMAICLLATVVPALYAARMNPADGFRAQ
jgi:lipoprotein-releasing system permease protein